MSSSVPMDSIDVISFDKWIKREIEIQMGSAGDKTITGDNEVIYQYGRKYKGTIICEKDFVWLVRYN